MDHSKDNNSLLASSRRTTNFTISEETILLALVQQYQNILENKKTDSGANRKKQECWVEIEKKFNSRSGSTYRGAIILKKKYENMKKKTKKKLAEEKCFRKGTGGGPEKKIEITDVDNAILEILGKDRVEGLSTHFGGDAQMNIDEDYTIAETLDTYPEEIVILPEESDSLSEKAGTSNILLEHDYLLETCTENRMEDKENENNDWSKPTPTLLKTPKSSALTTGKKMEVRENITKKIQDWAEAKTSKEYFKEKCTIEENKLKLKLMQEKHDVEISILKNESETKIKNWQKENDIRIEAMKEEQKIKKEILLIEKMQTLQKYK